MWTHVLAQLSCQSVDPQHVNAMACFCQVLPHMSVPVCVVADAQKRQSLPLGMCGAQRLRSKVRPERACKPMSHAAHLGMHSCLKAPMLVAECNPGPDGTAAQYGNIGGSYADQQLQKRCETCST